MSLIKKLNEVTKQKSNQRPILFTTPSHAQGEFIPNTLKKLLGKSFFKCDYSEIDGFDNLRNPTGILQQIQSKLANIYDTKATFMLTNGSTAGILALMLATLKKDDKVLIARNCHISIYNGLVLTGAKPIWIYPNLNTEWNIYESINPDLIEEKLSQEIIKAVILTSPTYEGVFSDIKQISEICKKNKALLIVDEAHGALTQFADKNITHNTAIKNGADASVQSLHKTAGAPNPCALLHIGKKSILTQEQIQEALNLINTTSPSYPLLAAIEGTVDYLISQSGKLTINQLFKNIDYLKKTTNPNVEYFPNDDSTKLVIRFKNLSTEIATKKLNDLYKIEEEYSTNNSMLFITGLGTSLKKIKKLKAALNKLAKIKTNKEALKNSNNLIEPIVVKKPSEIFLTPKQKVPKEKSIGKICAEVIVKYPPGIPIILPGEKIQPEHISYIENNYINVLD